MADYHELLKTMKTIAIEAIEAKKPVILQFGTVLSSSPLQVQIDQKLILSKMQLVATDTVITNGLSENDSVVLIRMQGGQKYLILDKIGVIE